MNYATLADDIEQQLAEFNELSIDDVHTREQWVWRQIIATTRDVSGIDKQLREVHEQLDPKWDLAYEQSMLVQDKRLNARFHQAVADNLCRDMVETVKGLEAQKRIAERWLRSLDKIHIGLMGHAADIRALGGRT